MVVHQGRTASAAVAVFARWGAQPGVQRRVMPPRVTVPAKYEAWMHAELSTCALCANSPGDPAADDFPVPERRKASSLRADRPPTTEPSPPPMRSWSEKAHHPATRSDTPPSRRAACAMRGAWHLLLRSSVHEAPVRLALIADVTWGAAGGGLFAMRAWCGEKKVRILRTRAPG